MGGVLIRAGGSDFFSKKIKRGGGRGDVYSGPKSRLITNREICCIMNNTLALNRHKTEP